MHRTSRRRHARQLDAVALATNVTVLMERGTKCLARSGLTHFHTKEDHSGYPQGKTQQLQQGVADGLFLVQLGNQV